jgi:hypothetical protein
MKLSLVCAFGLLVVGCGTTCADRSGVYRSVYTERSGTCGELEPSTFSAEEQPTSVELPCTDGEIRYSDDNCEVSNINVTCPGGELPGDRGIVLNSKYTWNEEGDAAFGVSTILILGAGGRTRCQSTYDVSVTRL